MTCEGVNLVFVDQPIEDVLPIERDIESQNEKEEEDDDRMVVFELKKWMFIRMALNVSLNGEETLFLWTKKLYGESFNIYKDGCEKLHS